ncbi:MAG: LLM class F420-dependent oxidoreductase [Propionibacteriaceae bacterium]
MDLRIFTEPQQGALYSDLLRVALTAESLGYSAFFRSDHYLAMGSEGLPGPTDAWLSLAGLARETKDIRLGTLVTSATFRLPGPLAIQVAQVDEMSRGRVEFGLGAGWFAEEHAAYGIGFPDVGERFDRLEESLEVITGLWRTPAGGQFNHDGPHYPISDSPGLPKPVQPGGPPIIVGGKGKKRTPALAARYAAEFNLSFPALADAPAGIDRVRAACHAIDRDPASLTYSAALVLCCGRDDAEVSRRAAAIGRDAGELRENGLAGTPDQVVERIGQFAEAGVERLYLQVLDLSDLDHLALVAQEVKPQVS